MLAFGDAQVHHFFSRPVRKFGIQETRLAASAQTVWLAFANFRTVSWPR